MKLFKDKRSHSMIYKDLIIITQKTDEGDITFSLFRDREPVVMNVFPDQDDFWEGLKKFLKEYK